MGCGCNKKVTKEKPVSKTKEVLRKMWKKKPNGGKTFKC